MSIENKKPYLDKTEAQKKEYEENMKVYRQKKAELEKAAAALAQAQAPAKPISKKAKASEAEG